MTLTFKRVEEIGTEVWEAAKDLYYEISACETEDLIKTNNETAFLDSEYSVLDREEAEAIEEDLPEDFVAAVTFHQSDFEVFTAETPESVVYASFRRGYEPETDASAEEIAQSWRAAELETAIENWATIQRKAMGEAA